MTKPLDKFIVCKIVAYRECGLSYSQIREKLGLKSISTVSSAYLRYLKTKSYEPKKPTGRPPKLTKRDESWLVRDTLKDPKKSLQKIRVWFNSFSTTKSISVDTVRRILRKYKIKSRSAAKKISLNAKSRNNRVKWCQKMLKITKNDPAFWFNVVFTDETRVRLNSDGIVRVLRKPDTRYQPQNTKNLSNDKRSIMFWGAIRSDGRKMLTKCSNNLNSDEYKKILVDYREELHFNDLIFQQDNAPIHRALKISNFFSENNWKTLDWPPYSPDINIIENLWGIIKQRLRCQSVSWTNLEEKVLEVWNSLESEIIVKLYLSMEDRLRRVIKAKGALTKY